MTRDEFERRARRAGLKPIICDGVGLIAVRLEEPKTVTDPRLLPISPGRTPGLAAPPMTGAKLKRWVEKNYERPADFLAWLRAELGTKYRQNAYYEWIHGARPVPARVRALIATRAGD